MGGTARRATFGLALLAALVACGQPSPPSAAQTAQASAAGFDIGLVYVTKVDGFTLAAGGSGVYGDAGFQAIYTSATGEDLRLTVERATLTAETCAALPIPAAVPVDSQVTCTAEGAGWKRSSGDRQEYALAHDDVLVRASGPTAISAETLRAAATDARPATSEEAAALLPPAPGEPVERGDISGDNAPNNPVGAGG